jgi:methionine aminotransferase
MLADYSAVSGQPDTAFCEELTRRHGVAAIPLSPFCDEPPAARLVRFCFAKEDGTLESAAAKLRAV